MPGMKYKGGKETPLPFRQFTERKRDIQDTR